MTQENMKAVGLYEALRAIQGEIHDPPRDGSNPHLKSKYATLPAILQIIRPLCAKHGVVVTQTTTGEVLTTTVTHAATREVLTLTTPIIIAGATTPQSYGSAVTYARRYALLPLFAIAGDDDDDGNAASMSDSRPPDGRNRRGGVDAKPPVVAAPAAESVVVKALRDECALVDSADKAQALLARLRADAEAKKFAPTDAPAVKAIAEAMKTAWGAK